MDVVSTGRAPAYESPMSILSARRLAKRYGSRLVVNNVDLDVHGGEIVGLLGPNGAGKTTSFYMIIGLVACDAGTVHLDEDDLTDRPMHVRARAGLGYLPQEPSIFRHLSVRDNVMAILETRPKLSRADREHWLETLLGELQVSHLAARRGDSLSGGERRRVEIARSLATQPQFMLLDEPFAGVDPISITDIQEIIRYLSDRGIGILITDHNVRDTLGICDHAYIVNEGVIIAQGTPEAVLRDERVREVYLGRSFRL